MKVRDVMTSPVVSVGPDTSLLEAGELMLRHDISGLPVLDKEARLVGTHYRARLPAPHRIRP